MTIDSFRGAYSFLSNFYPFPITYRGKIWATAEHAYQAAKTYDPEWEERIRLAWRPAEAKALGRAAPMYARWDDFKDRAMRDILHLKFCGELKNMLLATGDEELVEGNTWGDTYWGVCKGEGQNRLGTLLMEVRSYLQEVDEAVALHDRLGFGDKPTLEALLSRDIPFVFDWSISRYSDGEYGPWWASILLNNGPYDSAPVRKKIKAKGRTPYHAALLALRKADESLEGGILQNGTVDGRSV